MGVIVSPKSETTPKPEIFKDYATPELIDYNYNVSSIKLKEAEDKTLRDALLADSKLPSPTLRPDEISAKKARRAVLKTELDKLYSDNSALYKIYVKDYVNYRRAMWFNFGPARSEAFFDIMYDKNDTRIVNVLNNAGFNFGSSTAALYTELASGHLKLFRVSLGATVVGTSEHDPETAKEESAYQRLATNGGNTSLTVEIRLSIFILMTNILTFFPGRWVEEQPTFRNLGQRQMKLLGTLVMALISMLTVLQATAN